MIIGSCFCPYILFLLQACCQTPIHVFSKKRLGVDFVFTLSQQQAQQGQPHQNKVLAGNLES